jgi:hypothetical protein
MEVYLLIPLFGGLLIVLGAWIWLLVCAFRQSIWWGLGSLIVPPWALWFAVRHGQHAIAPLVLAVAGGFTVTAPALYLLAVPAPVVFEKTSHHESLLWHLTSKALRSDLVHEWVESRAYFLQVGAIPVIACAWIWLLVRAFRERLAWGWASLFLPPVGVAFAARHPRRGAAPLILLALAVLVATVPAVYILCVRVDLGPRDKIVGGERHVTLTGWDRNDYSVLRLIPDVSVLQMANADVTDHVVEVLRGMKNLKELDLNGTQVTDAGLGIIHDLPALATLRLARTKITDRGFRDILATKESLMQLDLQHTQVSRDTVKAWRAAKPDRKALQ